MGEGRTLLLGIDANERNNDDSSIERESNKLNQNSADLFEFIRGGNQHWQIAFSRVFSLFAFIALFYCLRAYRNKWVNNAHVPLCRQIVHS